MFVGQALVGVGVGEVISSAIRRLLGMVGQTLESGSLLLMQPFSQRLSCLLHSLPVHSVCQSNNTVLGVH